MATVVGASTGSIDVKSTVDQLIEVEMVKRIDPIEKKVAARQASISAIAAIKTLASSLQDSMNVFADTAQFTASTSLTADQALTNLAAAAQGFVSSYNALQAAVVKYGSVDLSDPTRDTTSEVPLFGDSALADVKQLMRSGYSAGLKYTNTLSARTDKTSVIKFTDLGISRKTDGTLSFSKSAFNRSAASDTTGLTPRTDNDTLSDSVYAQPKLLDRFVAGTSSTLATSLATAGTAFVGTFDVRTDQYNSQLYTLRNKRTSESARIETQRERLLKTYSQLNSLLANMSSTSNFLTAQLASLSKNN